MHRAGKADYGMCAYLQVEAGAVEAGNVMGMHSKLPPASCIFKDVTCRCKPISCLQVGIQAALIEGTGDAAEGAPLGLPCCGRAVPRTWSMALQLIRYACTVHG